MDPGADLDLAKIDRACQSGHDYRQAEGGAFLGARQEDCARERERFGAGAFDRAAEVFRPVDIDGDGIPDQPRAAVAAEGARAAIKE